MSVRLKLIIAYDGGPFAGWQSQAHGNTVQDHLEAAFRRITGEKVRVHGAGRTDTGVHALGQCAHVDVNAPTLAPEKWVAAVNTLLPPAVRILRCAHVSQDFHARFSAKGKIYRYRIWMAQVLPPFAYGRAWHVVQPLDFTAMEKAAQTFVGRHNFAAFAVNRGRPETNTIRTIRSVKVRRSGPRVTLEFAGDGFLYKMARMLTGSLVQCAQGKLTVAEVRERLKNGRPAATRMVAPAAGLFLVRVRYQVCF